MFCLILQKNNQVFFPGVLGIAYCKETVGKFTQIKQLTEETFSELLHSNSLQDCIVRNLG